MRIVNLLPWRRRRLECDLERELEHHLALRVAELTHRGMPGDEALRVARLELGGVAQVEEHVRDTWTSRILETLIRDTRYAARSLRRSPTFTATAVTSLALGVAASTALFSILDQVLFRSLPVRAPERLVRFEWNAGSLGAQYGAANVVSYPLCRDIGQQSQVFSGGFCRHLSPVVIAVNQQQTAARAELVSGEYFTVLGVQPAAGRLIDATDDVTVGGHPVAVLSHAFWQGAFGGARDIVGRNIVVSNTPFTVIGVAPPEFHGVDLGSVPALWIPIAMTSAIDPELGLVRLNRRALWVHAFARLAPGITIDQARAAIQPWFKSTIEAESRLTDFPIVTPEQRARFIASAVEVHPASRGWSNLRDRLERPLTLLMFGTLLLLALATLNVAGLLVARGVARGRELTTRLALGASRGRLAVQLLSESLVLAVAGSIVGVLLSPLIIRGLLVFIARDAAISARVDVGMLSFALGASVVTGLICGIAPALQSARSSTITSLNQKSPTGGGARIRKALVIGQMAFALVLLTGAGLFVRTLAELYAKGPGFPTKSLVMFRVDPEMMGYPRDRGERVMRDVLRAVRSLPGVSHASVASSELLNGGSSASNMVIQREAQIVTDRSVQYMRVGPGFFAALGTRVVAGRDFAESDVRPQGAEETPWRSVIVNESFARKYFGGVNPIGHRLGLGNRPGVATNIEIIGVVRDFNRRNLREQQEQAFFPYWDRNSSGGVFYVSVHGDPGPVLASIRSAIARIDATIPMLGATTLGAQVDRSLATERMLAALSVAFAAIALLLSAVGLYGVMSFVVTRRTKELGLRAALGATRTNVVWLIVRDALMMVTAGTVIALVSAAGLARFVEAHLFGVQPTDLPTLLVATALLSLVALASATRPAWRAASVSPMDALRSD